MIGKLQIKVKYGTTIDYIHSLDSIKLAEKISQEQKNNNTRYLSSKYSNENKSGIEINELNNFHILCKKKLD